MADGRSRTFSILENFTLNPLPYPVLFILAVIFILLGFQWHAYYESLVETIGQNMGWLLLAIPVVILVVVRWLSTLESPNWLFMSASPFYSQQHTNLFPSEGGSPWGVAAVILLLLVLVHYQSSFLDSWFV